MNLKRDETNNAIVTRLANVREHSNADRLKLATALGCQVVVGLDSKDGDLIIYFDSNLRLSHEYLSCNNLYSNPELNVNTTKKGYFGKNGRVKAQKFRGEVSNGYVAELHSLDFIDAVDCSEIVFNEGDEFTHIIGVPICEKYIPVQKSFQGKARLSVSEMFHRHWDTKQLMRESDRIVPGVLFIEEKIHGTSGRTGNVLCKTNKPWWKFWKPKQEWRVVSGTRRVDNVDFHLPTIRQEIERKVAPHLHKGEQIYYEIYGYDGGKQIQSGFPYDCRGGEFKAVLYRVTITTLDGYSVDLNREQVYKRAEELGLEKPILLTDVHLHEVVMNFETDCLPYVLNQCKGKSALDAGTLREGIVVWFTDKDGKWDCLKHKSEEFLIGESKKLDNDIIDVEDIL